jgi:hypothetical protein
MRVLPTHGDGGGFFYAVIVKHATDRQVCLARLARSPDVA